MSWKFVLGTLTQKSIDSYIHNFPFQSWSQFNWIKNKNKKEEFSYKLAVVYVLLYFGILSLFDYFMHFISIFFSVAWMCATVDMFVFMSEK